MTMTSSSISIADIIAIIVDYMPFFELLTFSEEWMSLGKSFSLKCNNTMASKSITGNHWILADIEPVKEGKVCWRVNV